MQLVDVWVGHPPRGADSLTVGDGAGVGNRRLRTSHVVHLGAYLLVPAVFAAELLWRRLDPDGPQVRTHTDTDTHSRRHTHGHAHT